MKFLLILGIVLIVLGTAILGYRQFNYKTEEKVLDFGPIHATAEKTHTIRIPPIIGWALIGCGAFVLIVGARSKPS
jgi:uncharacterized membrane protein